jgi:hypothetical protein
MTVLGIAHLGKPSIEAATPAAMRAFFAIVTTWKLTTDEGRTLLGGPPPSTWFKWKKGAVGGVTRDHLERVSYVLGIYKALQLLLPNPVAADGWVRKPSEDFAGASALSLMLSGNVGDLYRVREYLDGQRGGWA